MLYTQNEYSFKTANPHRRKYCPTMLGTYKNHIEWKPQHYRLLPFSDDEVTTAIYQNEHQVPTKQLTGLAYYDNFLRWLHSIGRKNAASLKALRFEGMAKLHCCEIAGYSEDCPYKPCDDSVIDLITVYIPFIRKFCTGLEKLTIIVEEDNYAKRNPLDILYHRLPKDREAALRPLLQNYILQISSLKELVVLGSRYDTEQLDCAKPAAEFFRKRARERQSEQNQKGKAEADRIAPGIAAVGEAERRRHFRSVLDLRFGDAEKVHVPQSCFLRYNQ
jgi:hypothetical protein